MIQVILLVVGIIYAIRRPKLKRLAPTDFPQVPADQFLEWRRLELKSINVFLWATWGLFSLSIPLSVGVQVVLQASESRADQVQVAWIVRVAFIAVFLSGLLVAGIYGSKAQRIKKVWKINWPSKGGTPAPQMR